MVIDRVKTEVAAMQIAVANVQGLSCKVYGSSAEQKGFITVAIKFIHWMLFSADEYSSQLLLFLTTHFNIILLSLPQP